MKLLKKIFSFVLPILIGLALAFVIKTYVFTIVKVDGLSMYPNLQNNERVIELKSHNIKRDTVIVFDAYGVDKHNSAVKPDTQYVKRVIGLPGDHIEYKNNGKLYINGKFHQQKFISKYESMQGTLHLQLPEAKGVTLGTGHIFTVPKDKYFVLGDNRSISNDSRYYGFVPKDKIQGIVKAPFWNDKKDMINN
ncbi:signal peptidase I [Ligilactobacillus ceti]|uniref:Signal peptidase I n=1 Tax=Ligilactobacillus ceti DSM 22408 TaxID=1122146 RepID=A0A0R2KRV7_9LACO|nr:signal peptidase I [Ligilactobacillus ceti]KRN88836.1 Signal peptidase I [Ligilactobacillus ceti DSM 22408]